MREIALRNRDGDVVAVALVDDADYSRVAAYGSWSLSRKGYAMGNVPRRRGRRVAMHRVVLGLVTGDGRLTDHINGNRVDNRRANLREVTRSQNGQNQYPRPTRGVNRRADGRWRARAVVGGREYAQICDSRDEAARVVVELRAAHMTHHREAA